MRQMKPLMICHFFGIVLLTAAPASAAESATDPAPGASIDRSPVDLVLTPDEQWLVTANQTSSTISLVRVDTGEVAHEVPCGRRPAALAITAEGQKVLVTGNHSGELTIFTREDDRLIKEGEIYLGFQPHGVAVTADGSTALVALSAAHEVAVVDLPSLTVTDRIGVGRWPRFLALSPDGTRLAVAASGSGGVSVVDPHERKLLFEENFVGLNLGQMFPSSDNRYVYFPWVSYGANPITPGHVRQGWVIASRIARVRLDEQARRGAIALDPQGQAVGDPHGLAVTSDGQWMVATAAGTHELLAYRLPTLTFQDYGGPGDHIDPALLHDDQRYYRLELGGRPMAIRMSNDDRHVYVANYLSNAVQVVDLEARQVARTIHLGGAGRASLARRGESIFYDAKRSLDQWYSCHTCHWEGGANAVTIDTMNDGSQFSYKTVPELINVTRTAPWTWHGWQKDLSSAMRKSLTQTMLGPEPTDDEVEALIAYLETLTPPRNPHLRDDGSLTEAALRGKQLFQSERAGCASCHNGEHFTDGEIHDVGLGGRFDKYAGFNTPSLVGVYRRVMFLHDGRAESLEELLTGPHSPEKVSGSDPLTEAEVTDLVAYLKSL